MEMDIYISCGCDGHRARDHVDTAYSSSSYYCRYVEHELMTLFSLWKLVLDHIEEIVLGNSNTTVLKVIVNHSIYLATLTTLILFSVHRVGG